MPIGLLVLLVSPAREALAQAPVTSKEYIYAGDRLLAVVAPPLLSIDDVAVVEGHSGTRTVTFTVSVSPPFNQPIRVGYATANGTATAGSDYVATSGTLAIAALGSSGTFDVPIIGDTASEPRETFSVSLTNPEGAALQDAQGQATIVDDETTKYYVLTPCRIVDTRTISAPALAAGTSRSFPVLGRCGVPATARSVAVIVTTAGQTAAGNLRMYPAPGPPPLASAASFAANKPRANNGVFILGQDGEIGVRCDMPPGGQTHVILDVMGYFQ